MAMAASTTLYPHLVFVYGTLKRGENNYAYWLAHPCHSLFVGTARTSERYPFFVNLLPDFPGCSPCVLRQPAGAADSGEWRGRAAPVEGELFLVTEAMRRWLDVLEDVESGVYEAAPAEVMDVRPPPSLRRQLHRDAGDGSAAAVTRTLFEELTAPFSSGAGDRLTALVYFRASKYPLDWASAHPTSSTPLQRSFTAAALLAEYGPRFAGGVPAHLRSHEAAQRLQERLDALPRALQPPTAALRQRARVQARLSAAGSPPREESYYDCVADEALLPRDAAASASASSSSFVYGAPLLPLPLTLFIIDGIGDSTYAVLGNRTPLEVVAGVAPRRPQETPLPPPPPASLDTSGTAQFAPAQWAVDALSVGFARAEDASGLHRRSGHRFLNERINTVTAAGVSGLMDPVLSGRSCGSDTAHLAFFGYDPEVYYRGRGAYETLGTAVGSDDSDDDDGEDNGAAELRDAIAEAAIEPEKSPDTTAACGFVVEDEDVCFKSNFATFADGDEDGFGDEDAALERRVAPLSVGTAADDLRAADDSVAGELQYQTRRSYFVTHRRCDRDFTREGPVLCRYLNGLTVDRDVHGEPFDYPHVVKMKYATEHRCGVALSGARKVVAADVSPAGSHAAEPKTRVIGRLSDKISGTDCLKDGMLLRRCTPTVTAAEDAEEYARAVYTCRLVEAASAKLTAYLKRHAINEQRRQHNRSAAANGGRGARKNIANLILFRGASKRGWVPTFDNRHGLHGFIVAPTCIVKGLGVCCGLACAPVCDVCYSRELRRAQKQLPGPSAGSDGGADELAALVRTGHALDGATGDYRSDLHVKVAAGLHALRLRVPCATHNASRAAAVARVAGDGAEAAAARVRHPHHNFLVVHVKGVDDAGHDGNLFQKLTMIGRSADSLAELFAALPTGAAMAVIADHSTPLAVGDHCCEPVPVSVALKPADSSADAAAREYFPEMLREFLETVRRPSPAAPSPTAWRFAGRRCDSILDVQIALLEEKNAGAGVSLCDARTRYSEVAEAGSGEGDVGALGRFRGAELLGIMKRQQYYYHYV